MAARKPDHTLSATPLQNLDVPTTQQSLSNNHATAVPVCQYTCPFSCCRQQCPHAKLITGMRVATCFAFMLVVSQAAFTNMHMS